MGHICFNHQNIINGKKIGPSCQNNYDQLQKQLRFHPSKDPFTILDEKVHFHFFFPSKHVIVTNYSRIFNFIQLYQHCSCICDYNSRICDYTHLRLK
jgi:hypothetical protein